MPLRYLRMLKDRASWMKTKRKVSGLLAQSGRFPILLKPQVVTSSNKGIILMPSIHCMRYGILFAGVIVLLLASHGCTSGSKGQSPVKHFPLTVALSGSVGDNGNPLPEDIKALMMPIQAKNCSGILIHP